MKYEVWQDDSGYSMFPVDKNVKQHRKLLGKNQKLLRVIVAGSWEEAMKKHHNLMGWEPYKP